MALWTPPPTASTAAVTIRGLIQMETTENILVKVLHKDNSLSDWNSALQSVWVEDKDRPAIYSREKFLQDWNRHVPEPRSR